ncbi:MAG: peptide deformylase [Alphaproteobacteria bacterium]
MAVQNLVILPDDQLRKISKPVDDFGDDLQTLLDNMLETMYDAPGIGLAAIQIGVPKRAVTVDCSREEDEPKNPIFLINPEVIWTSEETSIYEEGCLSIPEYFEEVTRPTACKVQYYDRTGKQQELEADGLLATCLQHEVDHLNGVLFIDYISKLKRDRVVKKFTKALKQKSA